MKLTYPGMGTEGDQLLGLLRDLIADLEDARPGANRRARDVRLAGELRPAPRIGPGGLRLIAKFCTTAARVMEGKAP
jgi:hypothetical protein